MAYRKNPVRVATVVVILVALLIPGLVMERREQARLKDKPKPPEISGFG